MTNLVGEAVGSNGARAVVGVALDVSCDCPAGAVVPRSSGVFLGEIVGKEAAAGVVVGSGAGAD